MLTETGKRILEFMSDGMGTKEIARSLELSPRTIEKYKGRIYQKTGIGSETEAVITLKSIQWAWMLLLLVNAPRRAKEPLTKNEKDWICWLFGNTMYDKGLSVGEVNFKIADNSYRGRLWIAAGYLGVNDPRWLCESELNQFGLGQGEVITKERISGYLEVKLNVLSNIQATQIQ